MATDVVEEAADSTVGVFWVALLVWRWSTLGPLDMREFAFLSPFAAASLLETIAHTMLGNSWLGWLCWECPWLGIAPWLKDVHAHSFLNDLVDGLGISWGE